MNAIILAKKKSRRLSCNKALIEVNKEPLIKRTIKTIKKYCKEILIISDDERLDLFGKRFSDIFKDRGPISGLYTGLYYSDTQVNLVLASDMPFLDGRLIEYINIDDNFQAIIPKVGDVHQPLCAIYSKEIISIIKEQIENDKLSLNTLIKRLNAFYIDCKEFKNSFFNLNTNEQLKLMQNAKVKMQNCG